MALKASPLLLIFRLFFAHIQASRKFDNFVDTSLPAIEIGSYINVIILPTLLFYRYCASDCSFKELHYSYRVGVSTISNWDVLKDEFMKIPENDSK